MTVKGWDIAAKRDLTAQEPAATTGAELPDSPASLAAVFGSPGHVTGDRPRHTQAEVDAAARRSRSRSGASSRRRPASRAATRRSRRARRSTSRWWRIPFAGRYTLTHTRHVYETRTGYRTHFEISGRQERSLLGLASGGGGAGGGDGVATPGLGGVQVGIVTDNADPKNLGRVRVRLPYAGVDFVSDWARVAAPGNGASRGFVWIPEVTTRSSSRSTTAAFASRTCWAGSGTARTHPRPSSSTAASCRPASSSAGPGRRSSSRTSPASEGILVSSADGSIQVHVDTANKKVVVTADGSGTVEMKTGGNFTIDCQGSVKISGKGGVEISSPASTKVSGNGQLSLESGGVTSVKGSQVSLG